MKRLFLGLLTVVLLAGTAHALEETIGNFDSGADPITMGGTTFPFNNTADGADWANATYDNATYLGPTGQSFRVQWGGVSATDRYAGGGLFFAGGANATVNVSTYNCISFWVYTPNANTRMEIQMKDYVGGTEHAAKVKLSDYLKTGVNTWQQVIIPFDAFRRNLSTIDFTKARALVFSADYSNGLESNAAGDLFIDDVKFSSLKHAPARTIAYSGSDKGTANVSDMPGDTLLWWDQAASTVTTNEVTVSVSTGYAAGWVATPADINGAANTTYYFAYRIRNDGNAGDRICFSTQTTAGQAWPTRIYWDKDKSGSYTAGDAECWDSIGLLPDSTHYFLAGIFIPPGAGNGSNTTVRITARDAFGKGTNDNWPTVSNDDTLTDDITLSCLTPALSVVKSTDVAVARPGDTVTYTITITNNGGANSTNVYLTDVVPLNMELVNDTSGTTGTPTIQYYAGSSWSGTWSQSATRIRWLWSSIAQGGGSVVAKFRGRVK